MYIQVSLSWQLNILTISIKFWLHNIAVVSAWLGEFFNTKIAGKQNFKLIKVKKTSN